MSATRNPGARNTVTPGKLRNRKGNLMSELSLLELDAQFSELLPEREALGVVSGNLSLSHFNPCHDHHHHHHCEPPKQQHHCEPPKHDPCPPAKHDPCPPPHKPCD